MKRFYAKLPDIDDYAINRADNIIIACEEAEEPYYHEWPGYAEFHKKIDINMCIWQREQPPKVHL